LNQARKENVPVTIHLMNGFQIKGMIRGFDQFTIVIDSIGTPANGIQNTRFDSDVLQSRLGTKPAEEKTAEEKPAEAPAEEKAE
jgi:RNA-binding protein Hfq